MKLGYILPAGGGGGRKMVTLISIIENFGEIQAVIMKVVDFS